MFSVVVQSIARYSICRSIPVRKYVVTSRRSYRILYVNERVTSISFFLFFFFFFYLFNVRRTYVQPVFEFAVNDNESENRAEAASNSKQR